MKGGAWAHVCADRIPSLLYVKMCTYKLEWNECILALCDIPLSTLEQLLPPQVSLKLSFEVVGIRPYQQNIVFPLLKLPEQNCTLSFQLAVFCKLMKGFLFRISAKTEVR